MKGGTKLAGDDRNVAIQRGSALPRLKYDAESRAIGFKNSPFGRAEKPARHGNDARNTLIALEWSVRLNKNFLPWNASFSEVGIAIFRPRTAIILFSFRGLARMMVETWSCCGN